MKWGEGIREAEREMARAQHEREQQADEERAARLAQEEADREDAAFGVARVRAMFAVAPERREFVEQIYELDETQREYERLTRRTDRLPAGESR